MIELDHVTVCYEKKMVLDQLSIRIEEGQTICITGRSGAGKTTLLKVLMNLIEPSSGTMKGLCDKRISSVFQENRLCENLSALRNVALVLQGPNIMEKANEHLSYLLPNEDLTVPVSSYSGGMKRRVALARAIASESDVILLDEPFNGLDKESMERAIRYIKEYRGNRTILFIAHKEEEVILMEPDRLVAI